MTIILKNLTGSRTFYFLSNLTGVSRSRVPTGSIREQEPMKRSHSELIFRNHKCFAETQIRDLMKQRHLTLSHFMKHFFIFAVYNNEAMKEKPRGHTENYRRPLAQIMIIIIHVSTTLKYVQSS